MPFSLRTLGLCLLLSSSCLLTPAQNISLPPDFYDQTVTNGWPLMCGFTFDSLGYLIGWTKTGQVYRSPDGIKPDAPLLDIGEEVGVFGDHGLMSVALDPAFLDNGRIYLMYVVDRHHLHYAGTPAYDPQEDDYDAPTIGRITRYTVDVSTFEGIVPNSRRVLLGQDASSGFPLLHKSHGVGALRFGRDGSLLATCGDGGSYIGTDIGGDDAEAKASVALAEGIITPAEDVGAFRSQLPNSLNGKILRINPEDGSAYPSNPFYQADDPHSPASKVWTMGLRNAFRFQVVPGTGSPDPNQGDPGVLLVSDVGWANWEEINVVTQGGLNLGWPLYEGLFGRYEYAQANVENLLAPNVLGGSGECPDAYFLFEDLLTLPQQGHPATFPHPCDPTQPIPSNIPQFVMTPPVITYSNAEYNSTDQAAYVPAYDEAGSLIARNVTDLNSPVASDFFNGTCTVGGTYVDNPAWPAAYRKLWLLGDYNGWIRGFRFDEASMALMATTPFLDSSTYRILNMQVNPADGCLWFIHYGNSSELHRICFGGNPPPTAVLQADQTYGLSPLTVQFSAEESYDPEGDPLTYQWDFGDGEQSQDMNPTHTFEVASGDIRSYLVQLTVTDSSGASHQRVQSISVNNSPPQVEIVSFPDSAPYSLTGVTDLPLQAEVRDAEHADSELRYAWQTTLHHNTHIHPEPVDSNRVSSTLLDPVGCGEETYWYEVALIVTDPGGLSSQVTQQLFPYCGASRNVFNQLTIGFQEPDIEITWTMAQEEAGTIFTLHRSANGRSFELVGTIAGDQRTGYTYVDRAYNINAPWYRLEARSPDGLREYSPVLRFVPQMHLFPNPAQDILRIRVSDQQEAVQFEIFDLSGRLIQQGEWPAEVDPPVHTLSLAAWRAGVYVCRMTYLGQTSHHRFSIMR